MRKQFTLIELLMVIVVMGILVAIVAVNTRDTKDEATATAVKGNMRVLQTAIDRYRMEKQSYPTVDGVVPSIGKPQPLDFESMTPKFLKSKPERGNYWLDHEGVLYGAVTTLPTSFVVNGETATWDVREDVSEYIVWRHEPTEVTGSVKKKGWSEVKRVKASVGTTTLPSGSGDIYIQAVDRLGFETPIVTNIPRSGEEDDSTSESSTPETSNSGETSTGGKEYEELGRVVLQEDMGERADFVGFDVIAHAPEGTRVVYEFSSSDDMVTWSPPQSKIEDVPDAKNLKVEIILEREVGSTATPTVSDASIRYESVATGQIVTKKTSYQTSLKPIVNLKLLTEGPITQGTPLTWDTSGTFLPDGSPIFNPQYMVSGIRANGLPNFLKKGDQEVSYSVSDRNGNTTTATVKVNVSPTDVTWYGNVGNKGPYMNTTDLPSSITVNGMTSTWDKNLDGKVIKAWLSSSSTGTTYLEVTGPTGAILYQTNVRSTTVQERTFIMPAGAVQIKLRSSVGYGGLHGFVDMADKTAPASPDNLSYTATSSSVTLMWGLSKSSDYAKTEIFRDGNKIGTVWKGTNHFTDRSLYSDQAYTYELIAYDTSDNPSEKTTFSTRTKIATDGYDWRGFLTAKAFDGDDETYETVREKVNATIVTTEKDMGGRTLRVVAATTSSSSVSVADRVTYVEFLSAANTSLGMMSFNSTVKVAKTMTVPVGTKNIRVYSKKFVGYIHEMSIVE